MTSKQFARARPIAELEWLKPDDLGQAFRSALTPVRLTFRGVSSLRIEVDWAAATAGMTPFSMGQILRKKLEWIGLLVLS